MYMCGTHIYMSTTSRTASTPTSTTDAPAGSPRHDALDDALVAIRRVLLRPGYRARLLEGLPGRVEFATLRLLRTVQRHEGPPSIGEVAEVLTIDPSTASRVVDRGVEAGLLERRACTDDRRRARLHLTPTGRDLLDRATARRRELLAEVTAEWDDEALDLLIRQLTALIEGFDQLEGSA
jgi:DNA-binding MarR family transcriptional regulator